MLALTRANLKMMVRNRHTTFWALLFPLLLVVVFGIIELDGIGSVRLAVVDQAQTPQSRALMENLEGVELVLTEDSAAGILEARRMVENGDLDYLLVIPDGFGGPEHTPVALTYSSRDPERNRLIQAAVSSLATETTRAEGAAPPAPGVVSDEIAVGRVSYFDMVLLGLVGLGIMTNSIISIAVKISTYRNQAILKRMLVTPLAIWKYFAAEITAHLMLALVQAAIILAVGVLVFGAQMPSNLLGVLVVVLLGSLVFLNIGFILSAWANTPSAASGMGNVIALPMIFLAGTFFSTASLPWLLPYLAQALPLTPMLSALREVAIDNAPLWAVWPQLAALMGWVLITSLAAVKVFRFS
jgi:ABC-2 type transport system permease protein